MKRLKSIWVSVLTIVLAITLMVGGTGLAVLAETGTTTKGTFAIDNVVFPSQLEYGKSTTIQLGDLQATDVTIKKPNGSEQAKSNGGTSGAYTVTFTPNQVGVYSFEYKSGNSTYTRTAVCKLDGEYRFTVDNGGADIPTFYAQGKTFNLPSAVLEVQNDDGEWDEVDATDVDYNVYANDGITDIRTTDNTYKFDTPGTHTIRYVAQLKDGSKFYSQDFTVNVQKDFEDKVKPTMNVVSVPTEISLNTKVTLPKATATDDFDENVRVHVSVKFNNTKVRKAIVDPDTGFATGLDADINKIYKFDNNENMFFYPTQEGTYAIEYYAEDDYGQKSSIYRYNARAYDKSAPTLNSIEEELIPTVWGLDVNNKAADIGLGDIVFPYPEYIDNAGNEAIRVSFEIRDTVNNLTVIKFSNIYDGNEVDGVPGAGAKYTRNETAISNGIYGEVGKEHIFHKDAGFTFNFNDYISSLKQREGFENADGLGRYTVTYQARDGKPNITNKTYDITLEDEFTDEDEPHISVKFDEYIYISETEETEYTVPTATITDANDTRPVINYTISTLNPSNEIVASLAVKSGETIKLTKDAITNENNDAGKDTLDISNVDGVLFSITAIDDAKNTAFEGDKANGTNVNLIKKSAFDNYNLDIDTNGFAYKVGSAEVEFAGLNANAATDNFSGQRVTIGDIAITGVKADLRDFTGFELTLTNADYKLISGLSLETFFISTTDDNDVQVSSNGTNFADGSMIVLRNISFRPERAAKYYLFVRAFDITGNSKMISIEIDVKQGDNTDITIGASTPIGVEGRVHVSYKLKNANYTTSASNVHATRPFIVRQIEEASKFSLMGSEFTALETGTYFFTDVYYSENNWNNPKAIEDTYTFDVKDNSNPAFAVQGVMPTYGKKFEAGVSEWVYVPSVIAFNDYANADIELTIKSPVKTLTKNEFFHITKENADDPNVVAVSSGDFAAYPNGYKFKATRDGRYTLTYKASINGSEEVSQEFTISIGDIMAPIFSVSGTHATTAVQNTEFSFFEVTLDAHSNDLMKDITFTKKLIGPDGTTEYTVSGKGETNGAKATLDSTDEKYLFTKTGTYTVEYSAEDLVGNRSVEKQTINVSGTGSTSNISLRVLSTVFIIIAILLIVGVIIYFARFRKIKVKN